MKHTKISQLQVGDKLYRVKNTTGKVMSYTVESIVEDKITISNDKTHTLTSLVIDPDDDNINDKYWMNPIVAVWMEVRKIRKEQYELEQKRIQIIKANKIKVTIHKDNLWNKIKTSWKKLISKISERTKS